MFFIKLLLIYVKNRLLFLLKYLKKKPVYNFKVDLKKDLNLKEKNLKLELIVIKFIPLTFHYEPLLFNIKDNSNLEDSNLKNKFKKKFVPLNSKYIKLNNLLLNYYNINILKKKNKTNINLHYLKLTNQERNNFVNYYNSDLLFIKNSFIFYEDAIILNKKKYLSNYTLYKKYGFLSYSDNLFSSNETKITNISSYSFRLEDGGTVPTWTSFIFNDSMKFLFFFYIPYIFYSYLQFTFLYMLILLVLSSDFIFIFKNYLVYSSFEPSIINLILYKILFDNPLILFFQNIFLIYFDFLIKLFYYISISIHLQIFFFILFFLVLIFWVYENIINLLLLDFLFINLKNKEITTEEISSFVDDFLNDDTTEEIRDVHMPMTFADNNIPHREGDSYYDIPRGTDYQKFITPFFTLYLFFVASWNYLFLTLFFYISYKFWSDFNFFIYTLKFYLFKFFDFTNLNSFFYYNIDFDFFSYLPLFYYILPFIVILFIITFSLKFSGFTYLYEDLYVKYKLKTEKGLYIYYNLIKKINLKTLFINLFSTKSVYYVDRNLLSNKNTNIFYFCLNMFFLFLNPLKNIFILLLFLLVLGYLLNNLLYLIINIFVFFLFILKVVLFSYFLYNIKLFFVLKFLIFYIYIVLYFVKIFFYIIILFCFLIFSYKTYKYFYLLILNIAHFFFKFYIRKNSFLFLCLSLIIFRLFFFKFIYVYFFLSFLCFSSYFFFKPFFSFLYYYICYIFNYIRFLFIKSIFYILKYKSFINLLFFLLILIIFLNYLFKYNILLTFISHFLTFYFHIYSYVPLFFYEFVFFFIFFFIFFYFSYFVIFLLFLMSQEYIFFKWLNYYLKNKSLKKIKYVQNTYQVKKYLKKNKKNYIFKESTNYLKRKDYFLFFSSIYTYHKAFRLISNEYYIVSKKMLKYKRFKTFIFFQNSFTYFLEFFYLKVSQSIFIKLKFLLLKTTYKLNFIFLNVKNKMKFILKLEHYYFSFYERMYLFQQSKNNSLVLKELAFLKKKYGQDSDIFSKIDHKVPLNIFLNYDFVFIYIIIISIESKENELILNVALKI